MTVTIPDSHRDLLDGPCVATLTTLLPDGQPHMTAVWCSYDGTYVLVNTEHNSRKAQNMQANKRVGLLVVDPRNQFRYLEIRGIVDEMTPDGALEHADQMAMLYTNQPKFYGSIMPFQAKTKQVRTLCKIRPVRVIARG